MSFQINLSDPNPPVRCFLEPGKEDPGKDPYLDIRPTTQQVLKDIRDKTHTKRFKNVRGAVHEYWDIDEKQYDLMLWGYCLPGWGNITDEKGQMIPYSAERAAWMIASVPYFTSLIGEKMDEVTAIAEERVKGRSKN